MMVFSVHKGDEWSGRKAGLPTALSGGWVRDGSSRKLPFLHLVKTAGSLQRLLRG